MEIILERMDDTDSRGIVLETEDFSLAHPEYTIGRAEDCDLRLQNRFVSRHHCELIVNDRDNVVRVRDLGSQNGTFVNEGPVNDECELKDGDTLVIGCVPFEVRIWWVTGNGQKKMTLSSFLLLVLIAGICGCLGQAMAGYSHGGCVVSVFLGLIGALLGTWLANFLGMGDFFAVRIGSQSFPIVWSVVGAALFVSLLKLFDRNPKY